MFGRWTFGRKVGAGFAVAALALLVIAITGYQSARSLLANNALVQHTEAVRVETAKLLAAVVDAETGQRGFVITGREEFLEPYNQALGTVDRAYLELRRLTADNPEQQRRLDLLKPQIDTKLDELKRVIAERRTSLEAAASRIAAGEGKVAMESVRRIVKEMDDDEARLLAVREAAAEDSQEITKGVILWGSIAALVLTILIGWIITSSLSKQIGAAVRNMQSSSAELQAAANQQASSATEQATAMTQIATTIRELLTTSHQIAESAQRVSQIAGETAGNARGGTATVAKGSESVATVRKQVDQIVAHMADLSRKAQQVGVVLDIVSELAEQTNILAINATIEAAGAGEAGRRFGVVADEIRKLADRVGTSTKEIREMVEGVRSAVNTTVMATEAGSKAVDASAVQVAEMASSFKQIASLVVTTTDAAREIELSTKQQATAVEQVNVAISDIAQASKETEASTTQTLMTAAQLASLSRDILKLVQSDTTA
ncbi:MAG: histidine kinase [Kofleriaceae bacterium]|nr:histidine kinase [Kofleriaceae bacterium]